MHLTNALRRNNDTSETKPKANKSRKRKHILKLIWDEKDMYTGNGITPSVPTIIYHVTLSRSKTDQFVNLKKYYSGNQLSILLIKGVYPYDYVDCRKK